MGDLIGLIYFVGLGACIGAILHVISLIGVIVWDFQRHFTDEATWQTYRHLPRYAYDMYQFKPIVKMFLIFVVGSAVLVGVLFVFAVGVLEVIP